MGLRLIQEDQPRTGTSVFGRYRLRDTIAVGRTASVHVGVLEGASGFRKPVAFKKLLASLVGDPVANARLSHEARVLSQIHHANVVQVLDLVEASGESYLVMEHVLGETLAKLLRSGGRCSIPISVAIIVDALRGLESAHSTVGATGRHVRIVHRNVCPDNLLVGIDGVTRIIDFGSSVLTTDSDPVPSEAPPASERLRPRSEYAAPEQLLRRPVDRRADLFAVGIILWEMLTGKRMFKTSGTSRAFLNEAIWEIFPPSAFNAEISRSLDAVVLRALAWSPEERFDSAVEFAAELEAVAMPAHHTQVAALVERRAAGPIKVQRLLLGALETPTAHFAEPSETRRPSKLDDATMRFKPDDALLHLSVKANASRSRPAPSASEAWALPSNPRAGRNSSAPPVEREQRMHPLDRGPFRTGSSTLLIGCVVALLLLAGVRLSAGTSTNAAQASPDGRTALAFHEPSPAKSAAAPARAPIASRAPTATPAPAAPPIAATPIAEPDRPRPAPPAQAPSPSPAPKRIAPPPPANRSSCTPPFEIDAAGIRRLKLQCL